MDLKTRLVTHRETEISMKLTEISDDEPIIIPILQSLLKRKGVVIRCDFHFAVDDPHDRFVGTLLDIFQGRHRGYTLQVTSDAVDEYDSSNSISMGPSMLDRLELKQSVTDGEIWILTYADK